MSATPSCPEHPVGVGHLLKWEMSGILGLGETVERGVGADVAALVRVRRRCVQLGEESEASGKSFRLNRCLTARCSASIQRRDPRARHCHWRPAFKLAAARCCPGRDEDYSPPPAQIPVVRC